MTTNKNQPKEIKIKNITIELSDGKTLVLTIEEAKKLKEQLNNLFKADSVPTTSESMSKAMLEELRRIRDKIPYEPYRPLQPLWPIQPYERPYFLDNPITIACGSGEINEKFTQSLK